MKRVNLLLIPAAAMLLSACSTAQPSVATDVKTLKKAGDKYYLVPAGTSSPSSAVDDKVIAFYHKIGVADCQKGDITWEELKTADSINAMMRNGTKEEGIALYKKAAKEGKVGCAHPLSDEAYKTYLKTHEVPNSK